MNLTQSKRYPHIQFLSLVLTLLLLLTGCSSGKLNAEIDALHDQILILESDIENLEINLLDLTQMNTALEQVSKELTVTLKDTTIMNEQLQDELLTAQEIIDTFQSETQLTKTESSENVDALIALFEEAKLDHFNFVNNIFFYESNFAHLSDPRNYDYAEEMTRSKDVLFLYEQRSTTPSIYNNLIDYGIGVIMDAIIPFSSLLLIFTDDSEIASRQANDLLVEINFNIEHGKQAGLRQLEMMSVIRNYYTHAKDQTLTEAHVIELKNAFMDYYENDLSKLSTILINEHKVSLMTELFRQKYDDIFVLTEEEEIANFEEQLSRIIESNQKLDALYWSIKSIQ